MGGRVPPATVRGIDARRPLARDSRLVLVAQGLRAFAYGFGAVLLGTVLDEAKWSSAKVGVLLTCVVAGSAIANQVIARRGDRWGRRRCYTALYMLLAATGFVFATTDSLVLLCLFALCGAMSSEVVESGPFTSLEQAMLANDLAGRHLLRGLGLYNASATITGSLGALAAGGPKLIRDHLPGLPSDQRLFLIFIPVALAGAVVSRAISAAVEAPAAATTATSRSGLERSRPVVLRLCVLFATDSFAGGFVVQAYVVYYLRHRFGAPTFLLGVVFFSIGILQTISFLLAPVIAQRIGLLNTMVLSHLPSNMCLVGIAFSPSLRLAVVLLFLRGLLGQMDVPTRQAYVMALVDPAERVPAAATTGTARYVTRPVAPVVGGVLQRVAVGLPFLVAGALKTVYDIVLWRWFRRVPLTDQAADR